MALGYGPVVEQRREQGARLGQQPLRLPRPLPFGDVAKIAHHATNGRVVSKLVTVPSSHRQVPSLSRIRYSTPRLTPGCVRSSSIIRPTRSRSSG